MYPNKQDKNQKLRYVRALYRKNINKTRTDDEETKVWKVLISICVLAVFFICVIDVLFDIGVSLPALFGI